MKLTEITSNALNLCNTLSRCFGLEAENERIESLDETGPCAPPVTGLLGRATENRLRSELSQRVQQHDATKRHQTGLPRSDAGEKINTEDPTQIKSLQEAGEGSTRAFDEALNKCNAVNFDFLAKACRTSPDTIAGTNTESAIFTRSIS